MYKCRQEVKFLSGDEVFPAFGCCVAFEEHSLKSNIFESLGRFSRTSSHQNHNNNKSSIPPHPPSSSNNNNISGAGTPGGRLVRSRSLSGLTQEQSQRIHALASGPWATNAALYQKKNRPVTSSSTTSTTPQRDHHQQQEHEHEDNNTSRTGERTTGNRRPSLPDRPGWVEDRCNNNNGGLEAPSQVSSARERNSYERHVAMMRCRPPREVPRDFFIKSVSHPRVLKRPVSARIVVSGGSSKK